MSDQTYNVLFVSERNSARSIFAEALLNDMGRGRFHAYSAGNHPAGAVDPNALEKLQKEGIPAPDVRSKAVEELVQPNVPPMDFVISLGEDELHDLCPIWPGHPIIARWPVHDPVADAASSGQSRLAFAKAFAALERRVALFASLNPASLKRLALSHYLREIGAEES